MLVDDVVADDDSHRRHHYGVTDVYRHGGMNMPTTTKSKDMNKKLT